MADGGSAASQWVQKAALIAVAGVVYTVAEVSITRYRATLPALAYIECMRKLGTFDWAAHGITNPGAADDVCRERTGYRG